MSDETETTPFRPDLTHMGMRATTTEGGSMEGKMAISYENQKCLCQEVLVSVLGYDKDTGIFIWKINSRTSFGMGSTAGTTNVDGYRSIKYKKHLYACGRLAWLYVYGEWPNGEIDHINGERGDNRISNLRVVTKRENSLNKIVHRLGRLPGSSRSRNGRKWRAGIKINGNAKHLGTFDTEKEASDAYFAYLKEIN